MEFKRLNKNSQLIFIENDEHSTAKKIMDMCNFIGDVIILQIVVLSIGLTIIEYIPREQNVMTNDSSFERDIEFENNLDTIINTDPFGAKYSGKSIREIFECGDREWLDKALKLMHNEFIRKKLQYIVDRGGYGKIKC